MKAELRNGDTKLGEQQKKAGDLFHKVSFFNFPKAWTTLVWDSPVRGC